MHRIDKKKCDIVAESQKYRIQRVCFDQEVPPGFRAACRTSQIHTITTRTLTQMMTTRGPL